MSLGNDNATPANLGSNFNFQLKVLQALTRILTGTSRIPALVRYNGSGVIAAGAKSVSVYNSGAADGLLLGTIIHPTERVTYSAENKDVLAAISYNATGTEFLIATLV